MPRSIAGHGRVSTRYPPSFGPTVCPLSLTISAPIPGNGRVADPGLSVVTPGRGVIRIIPVSVCHQVSTNRARPAADVGVVPDPSLGVDRFTDRPQQSQ